VAEAAELQGTTSARARRWRQRTAALLAGAPLLAGAWQLPAAQAAHAAGQATGTRTVDVSINSLTPDTPAKGDNLTVKGIVTNNGASALTDAEVDLRVGPMMTSRSQIDTVADRTGYSPGLDGTVVGGTYADTIGKLPSGVSRGFALSVPMSKLHLGGSGVYQIGVSLTGATHSQPWQQVLGIKRTFLPWQPTNAPKKTQLTVLWPLISTPHITARTAADQQQTPIFSDDDLAKEFAPGGRLQQLVALGKNLPVTWVIDPDLLATADAMTRDYQVQVGSGGGGDQDPKVRDGKGQAVAKAWLDELEKAVAGHEVVALPFADPDLASIAHHGKNVPGAIDHLKSATKLASDTVDSILGVKPRTDFAWPADGAIDPSIVDVAAAAGARNIITRSDSLKEARGMPYTPTAARRIGGGNTAIVTDTRLSTEFSGDMVKAENATLAIQEFLAQTQMVTLQAPEKQRSIVVAPQRMPTTSQAQAMATALGSLQSGRWSEPLSLGQAAKITPDPNAAHRVPSSSSYPSALRKQELPESAFRGIRTMGTTLSEFEEILSAKDRVAPVFDTAIMREMSTSWRGTGGDSARFRDAVQSYLDSLTNKVHFVPKTDMTLSGRSATIPVTVQNNLVQGVEGLRLKLWSSQRNRLAVSDPQVVDIGGGHSQSVKFGTTANANGRAWITAQLYTQDGRPYGQPMRFQVNVTEITSTIILVIAGGVLLLVLAGVRIYIHRKRDAARNGRAPEGTGPADAAVDAAGPAADPAVDAASNPGTPTAPEEAGPPSDPGHNGVRTALPQQPSDPIPDTGSQSAGPSGSGEKVDH
jgi:Family of unknown function (DUF6049)